MEPDRGGDRLRRDDPLYDFIVEIDHNTQPRIAGGARFCCIWRARISHRPPDASMTKIGDAAIAAASLRTKIVIE